MQPDVPSPILRLSSTRAILLVDSFSRCEQKDQPVVTHPLRARRFAWRPLTAFCLTAAIAVAGAVGASAQTLDSALRNKDMAVIVEIDGSLPGFSKDELTAYICQQMVASHATSWHFVPTSASSTGGDQPSDRIV